MSTVPGDKYDLPPQLVVAEDGSVSSVKLDQLAERRRLLARERRARNPNFQLWQLWGLQLSDTGGPLANIRNAASILECDGAYKGRIYLDEFLQRVMVDKREWIDADDIALAIHMQGELGIPNMGRDTASNAVVHIAYQNKRNCVHDWLNSLTHDGTARIEHFFSDYFGAKESEYTKAASCNFWISLVARAYRPGCKVDNMIVLEGPQGVGKSKALAIIADPWFTEQHESAMNPKAFAEVLQGKILVEISEMDAFNRAEVNRVKQTITCVADRFRASYARHAEDHPRTCIFVGTTNKDNWQRDETGARRFWPIACKGDINHDGIEQMRAQLFAEAVTRYKANEPHWKMPANETQAEQDARFQADPWLPAIEDAIRGMSPVTTAAISTALGIEVHKQDRASEMRIGACLHFLGFSRKQSRFSQKRQYHYVKDSDGGDSSDKKSLFDS